MELRMLEYHYNNNISNNIYRTKDIACVSGKLSHFSGSCSFLKFPELRPLREKSDDNARTDANEREEREATKLYCIVSVSVWLPASWTWFYIIYEHKTKPTDNYNSVKVRMFHLFNEII